MAGRFLPYVGITVADEGHDPSCVGAELGWMADRLVKVYGLPEHDDAVMKLRRGLRLRCKCEGVSHG